MPAGRPLKFGSVEELQSKIDAYFNECDREEDTRTWKHGEIVEYKKQELCFNCEMPITVGKFNKPSRGCIQTGGEDKRREEYSITGLALALDTTRQTLVDYEEKDEFTDTIKKAKLRVENRYEKALQKQGRSGDIFALKNFNWKDKSESDVTSGGEKITGVAVEFIRPK